MTETCWFCKKKLADSAKPYLVPIHLTLKDEKNTYSYRATYRKSTVDIPRCRECKRNHTIIKIAKIIGICLTVIAAGLIMNLPTTQAGLILFLTMLILLIGGGIVQRQYLKTNPELAVKLESGWKLGEQPNSITR